MMNFPPQDNDGYALPDQPYQYTTLNAGQISVSDLERLAKAGVKIELNRDIIERVNADLPKAARVLFDPTDLVEPLVERWRQVRSSGDPHKDMFDQGRVFPFWLSAVRNGGTVYVFVACNVKVFSAQVIEDDARFYPSEALLAKLHLLLDNHEKGVV